MMRGASASALLLRGRSARRRHGRLSTKRSLLFTAPGFDPQTRRQRSVRWARALEINCQIASTRQHRRFPPSQ
jgi:hypothetical protein